MRRPGTILLLAVVIGALAAAVVHRNLRTQREEIEAARRASEHVTVDIVVANDTIPVGTRIAAAHVRSVRWPSDVQPEGASSDPAAVIGSVARTTIGKNQPVVQSMLVRESAGLLPLIIPEGLRAMSVKVDNVTGVSGFITPNSHVDVLIAGKPEGGDDQERSKLILQNVRVLATGTSIEQVDQKPVEVPMVTLLLSPEDAEKLTLAARHEPVRLALRSYRDEGVVGTPGVTSSALFASYKQPAPAPAVRKAAGGPPSGYAVDVFLGDKLTKQVLF